MPPQRKIHPFITAHLNHFSLDEISTAAIITLLPSINGFVLSFALNVSHISPWRTMYHKHQHYNGNEEKLLVIAGNSHVACYQGVPEWPLRRHSELFCAAVTSHECPRLAASKHCTPRNLHFVLVYERRSSESEEQELALATNNKKRGIVVDCICPYESVSPGDETRRRSIKKRLARHFAAGLITKNPFKL